MRYLAFLLPVVLFSCKNPAADTVLQTKVDSLQGRLDHVYRPGLGEFMLGIQVHHAKIWFAGTAGNWELTRFEMDELKEAMDDVRTFCTDRPEIKALSMIDAPIDSLNDAVNKKDEALFRKSFGVLTNTCNGCHQATNHAFNVIREPSAPPYTNQDFSAPANK